LEQSKAEAEKEMDDLRMALELTTMDAEVLSQKLQEKELAIGELSGKLYKECAAAEACANALAKALTESESELLVMKEENKLSKQRISELEKELRSSRLLIDKLSGEIERYKLREKDFEQFKTKFKYATKLYKSRIQDLRSIVAQRNLESSDADMEGDTHGVQETISIKLDEKENPPNIQGSFHIHTDDVEAESSPNKPVVSPSNGSNESNETLRQSKIRAAGGRAALRAKLKIRRQSKFERNTTEKPSILKPHNGNIRA
jgi:chromosome segregation ATPase